MNKTIKVSEQEYKNYIQNNKFTINSIIFKYQGGLE